MCIASGNVTRMDRGIYSENTLQIPRIREHRFHINAASAQRERNFDHVLLFCFGMVIHNFYEFNATLARHVEIKHWRITIVMSRTQ